MEILECYRAVILELLEAQTALRCANGDFERELLVDRDQDRYLVISQGWDGSKRVHEVVMHLDICNGKIWIQENRTNLDVAEELKRAGVPADYIVLGLLPLEVRQYSDYAVA